MNELDEFIEWLNDNDYSIVTCYNDGSKDFHEKLELLDEFRKSRQS